jgi:small subunit ribosomal protein S6
MRTYEVLFILNSQLPEQDATNLIADFRGIAEKSGATLINQEAWGRRRLAYPIEKMQDGIYHLFVFQTEGDVLNELDRRMKNSDQVVRHMIVRTDQDLKRAEKLAKRNPKKERVRPQPAEAASAPTPAAPPAAPAEAPVEAPIVPEAAPETGAAPAAE